MGHLGTFLTENKIINNNHHGGRKGHSTIPALNQIFNTSQINYENNKITGILITDMSKDYDTIDHFILLSKMEYYGIRGDALDIFTSYLTNRYQFLEIDIHRSQLQQSLNCSVIQGGKLSGLLYTIYTNEIPLLHTLMHNKIYTSLTNHQPTTTNNINHCTVNFVDDSTDIISTIKAEDMQEYLNRFYSLLEAVYNINKLKINNDKTELMMICKNRFRKSTKNIQMKASGHKVKQVSKVKIPGYIMQSNLRHDRHIAHITSNIHNRLHNIKKLSSHTTIKSRTILTKAIVIGKLNYCLPLLCNAKKSQLAKLNTLVMKSCRVIMGNPCLKWSNSRLLNKCKMHTIYHMITEQALNYVHKIQTTQTPQALYNMYKVPTRPQRTNPQLHPK